MSTPIDETPHHRALLAADQLETEGESVTADAVRRRAGVGMSTAAAAARHWKQLATQRRAAEEQPRAPAAIQKRVVALGETVWLEALEAARRDVVAERRAVEAERVRFAQETDDLTTSLETARAHVQRLEELTRQQEQAHRATIEKLEQGLAEIQTLSERLAERHEALLALRTQVARAEGAAEASRLAYQELLAATSRPEQTTEVPGSAPGRTARNTSRKPAKAVKDG